MVNESKAISRIVVVIMLASLVVGVGYDTFHESDAPISTVQAIAKQLRSLGQPFLLYSVSSVISVIAVVTGGILHFFGAAVAQRLLIAGVVVELIASPMVSVHVSSNVVNACFFLSAVSLGWLIATPAKGSDT